MAHAILPGAAVGFLFYGLEIVPMTIGGADRRASGRRIGCGCGVPLHHRRSEDASLGRLLSDLAGRSAC
jgi:zinc/manganese transport system permease protein